MIVHRTGTENNLFLFLTVLGNYTCIEHGFYAIISKESRKEGTETTIKQKVEVACSMAGITITELGKRLGMSQQSMSNRLKTGKFTQEELEQMGKALGAEYRSGFYFPDGNKVE